MAFVPFRNSQGTTQVAQNRAAQAFTSSPNPLSSTSSSLTPGVITPAARKQAIKLLSYPNDIGAAGQGHYVIFKIHDLNPGKVAKQSNSSSGTGGRQNRSLALKGTTKRTKVQIGLYMPPSVSVSYKSNYEDVEISGAAEAAADVVGGVLSGTATFSGTLDAVGTGAGDMLQKAGIKLADTVGPEGIVAAGQIKAGKIRSEKMELLFKGVSRRTFSYSFVFIPKSQQESQDVDKIIYEFKKAMLPSYTTGFLFGSGNDRTLTIPTTIDIEYFFDSGQGGKRNNYLNKISTCYLTDMDVSYGGDRYVAYSPSVTQRSAGNAEGAPPQRTSVTLNFSEIEIITQEDIDLGF